MNENTEKRIVVFTSQSLRQNGIRAVHMDDIAKNIGISKRTIYQVYKTKNDLVNTCLDTYLFRIGNLFHIIKYDSSDALVYLWKTSLTYMENLYKGECAFWFDVKCYPEYRHIYVAYNRIWLDGLKKAVSSCQQDGYIIPYLDVPVFLESFMTLLYDVRIAERLPSIAYNALYFMLRGILTNKGVEQLEKIDIRVNN